jgi:hypothetical protein
MSLKFRPFKLLTSLSTLLLGLFLAAAYIPLLLKGGIILDDWGDIAQTLHCTGFLECYGSWFPLFSNRPLAPLPITVTTLLFGLNTSWYLIVNTALYLGALFITAKTIKPFLSPFATAFFIALGSIPIIAMPIVVSPINQSTATLAFLLWAVSLLQLKDFCLTKSRISYLLAYFLLLASLLTYEVMLPLLVLTTTLPFVLDSRSLKNSLIQYGARFFLPVVCVLVLVLTWQKILAPVVFEIVHSRLSFDPNNIGFFFLSWLDVFYIHIPELLQATTKRINTYGYFVAIILCASLVTAWLKQAQFSEKVSESSGVKSRFVFICALCFFASPSIFILSGSSAEIGGYQARALSSTWLCFILLITSIINLAPRRAFALILTLVFSCFIYFAFAIQRDNYIRSWVLQKEILADALSKIETQKVSSKATVIANIPRYLLNNFNNEVVFSQPWDFGAALSLYTNQKIVGGAVLDTRGSDFSKALQLSNGVLSIDSWWKTDVSNLWFYDYNLATKFSSLRKISDLDDLKKLLVSIGYLGEFEKTSYITTNVPIPFAIDWLDRSKYILAGWGDREGWGGIWSTQNRATIKLPIPEGEAKSIAFNVNAFVTPTHPKQEVLVFINGKQQGKFILNKFEGNEITIPLPPMVTKNLPITIDFELPNAASPKSLNLGGDDRKLGIGLKSATFH